MDDPDYVMTLVFREKGAAIVLQHWWRFRQRCVNASTGRLPRCFPPASQCAVQPT